MDCNRLSMFILRYGFVVITFDVIKVATLITLMSNNYEIKCISASGHLSKVGFIRVSFQNLVVAYVNNFKVYRYKV